MRYNDADALQTWYFPFLKLMIVCFDYVVIASVYSIPLTVQLFIYIGKLVANLDLQTQEYTAVQDMYIARQAVEDNANEEAAA